jgi:holo-[acyl-carrier protein] synthase
MGLRIGMDLVETDDVAGALGEFGNRYLARIASDGERRHWPREGIGLQRHAAGAFAAKEAVLKTLGGGADNVQWRDIELQQHVSGEWSVTLREEAAALAAQLGVTDISVSIGFTNNLAAAIAIATTTEDGS